MQEAASGETILAMTRTMGKKKFRRMECTLDSGCVDHVFPRNALQEIEIKPSSMSQSGGHYVTATSESVPNLGQKTLQCRLNEGHQRTMVVQVAEISRPLLSAARLNDTGNEVVLHPTRPIIRNLATKEETALRRVGNTFLLDVWVEIPKGEGFARP